MPAPDFGIKNQGTKVSIDSLKIYPEMEKQESSKTLTTVNLNEYNQIVEKETEDSSPYNESNLDLFSHDSTHVRLVIEAERQTSLAREKAAFILRKLSVDVDDDKQGGKTTNTEQGTIVSDNDDKRDESDDDAGNNEPNLDNLRIQADFNRDKDDLSLKDEGRVSSDSKVFDQFEGSSAIDIEHLKRCIQPLSPSAKHKKRISGKFEFKRMNSVLTVVKSMDEESYQSYGSIGSKKSKSSKSSKSSRRTIKRKGSSGSKKSTNSFTQSNALTDDAWVQELAIKETRKMKKKKKKAGDLPPRSSNRRSYANSTGVAPSEADREDVISVVSNLSELSNESITQKARDNSPLVVTDSSQLQPRIPDTICLKTQQKISRMALLKRKLSFSRGKATF